MEVHCSATIIVINTLLYYSFEDMVSKVTGKGVTIRDMTLEESFGNSLTDVQCINIDNSRGVWIATLMCTQYLESTIDSIVVRDDDFRPIGIVGGYDLLDHLRRNPTRDSQYKAKVEEIMFRDIPKTEKETKLKDLINSWKRSGRAFAIIHNEYGDYSPVSARRMLEVGTRCKTDISISSMPKKKIVTFKVDEPLEQVLNTMYENKTRKLLLQDSNQYISDRLILGGISRMLNLETDIDDLLHIPINKFDTEEVKVIKDDLKFDRLCSVMDRMEHPFVMYDDTVITPWDVCLTLLSEKLATPLEEFQEQMSCPNCGKPID
jgi:CBS domain-containing protein